jgi:hypothetical protein
MRRAGSNFDSSDTLIALEMFSATRSGNDRIMP